MTTCPKCGATCPEKKDEKRFQRRHPAKCVAHERFQHALAADTASVDYDEQQASRDLVSLYSKLEKSEPGSPESKTISEQIVDTIGEGVRRPDEN